MTPNPINTLKITTYNTKHTHMQKRKNHENRIYFDCLKSSKKKLNFYLNIYQIFIIYILYILYALYILYILYILYLYLYIYIYTRTRVGPLHVVQGSLTDSFTYSSPVRSQVHHVFVQEDACSWARSPSVPKSPSADAQC